MLSTLLLCLPPLGDLLVVSPNPAAGEFASIQAAVDAAPSGATVVVRGGSYGEDLVLGDRSLTLVGLDGAELRGGLRVVDLAFDDDVLIDGLRLTGAPRGVELEACAGTVWLEDVQVALKSVPNTVGLALEVDLCDDVLITGGRFSGSFGTQGAGVAAGVILDSVVNAYDCEFVAVRPGDKTGIGSPAGLEVYGSLLFTSWVRIAGADGTASGAGPDGDCALGSAGGAGLVISEGQFIPSEVVLVAATVDAGGPGTGTAECPAPPGGKRLVVVPGNTLELVEPELPQRTLAATATTVVGEPLVLEFEGTPGEFVVAILGFLPEPVFEPAFGGVFGTFDTAFVQALGPLDPSGRLELTLPLNAPLGSDAGRLFSQGLFYGLVDGFVPTPPRSTLLLDEPL